MAVYVTPAARQKEYEEKYTGPGVQNGIKVTPQAAYEGPAASGTSGNSGTQSGQYASGNSYGSLAGRYQSKMLQAEANRPGPFQSQYTGQINAILDSILNREKFSYDLNSDPLYEKYRESYMHNGQKAMRDTMGQAAALTGGYGSTAATTAASQTYDEYMNALNDKIPELYQLAYNQYLNEGQNMYNQLGAVQSVDNTDYNRYRDTVSDYYNDLNYYSGMYNAETDRGMSADQFAQQMAWNQTQFDYQKTQDELAQQNWQAQFDYQKYIDAAKLAKSGGSGGGNSSVRSETSKIKSGGYDYDDILQTAIGKLKSYDNVEDSDFGNNESLTAKYLIGKGVSADIAEMAVDEARRLSKQ